MHLSDLKFLDRDLHLLHFVDERGKTTNWVGDEEVYLLEENSQLFMAQGDHCVLVSCAETKTLGFASAGLSLWKLAKRGKDHVHLQALHVQKVLYVDLNIAVDSYIADHLFTEGVVADNQVSSAIEWLHREFLLDRKEQWLIARFYKSQHRDGFHLLGENHSLILKEKEGGWYAEKISPLRRDNREMVAISGAAKFINGSVIHTLSSQHQTVLEQQLIDSGSYLSLWQAYSELQWKIATRAAKKLGSIRYKECKPSGEETPRFRFTVGEEQAKHFGERIQALQGDDSFASGDLILEIAEKEPSWLQEDLILTGDDKRQARPLLGRDIRISPPYIDIELRQKPPKSGSIFLSLQGDKTAHQRRELAYSSIQNFSNPMPQLKMLFEGIASPIERKRTLRPLSAKTRKRFRGEPTARQKDALKVALNTPDVALVIGPPGTGKTQVISALQQRIAEEFTAGEDMMHQVLLTSFQHDAVDNVVERSGVFGLPAVKIGGRRFGADGSEDSITRWRIDRLRELKPELERELSGWPIFATYQVIKEKLLELRISRELSLRKSLALDIDELLESLSFSESMSLSVELSDRWAGLVRSLSSHTSLMLSHSSRTKLLSAIRGVRSSIDAFNDDGLDRLSSLMSSVDGLTPISESPEINKLKLVYEELKGGAAVTEDHLEQIVQAKSSLLDAIRPDYRPSLLRSYLSEGHCDLLDAIEEFLEEKISTSRSLGPLFVRLKYLESLESSASMVERSIKEYVGVLGATCQQAAGDQMTNIKDVMQDGSISFDTVVVDEAARANPLDLMIPMAMAQRRIVLVGDHLQLPHMLEPHVESELKEQEELGAVEQELLKTSLFEHLHKLFLKLEKDGGPKRVVMLDTQFRMHPLLGRFVSQEFYERRGFDPISSGLPADNFEHDISGYEGCVATWIDIPKQEGTEQKRNGSRMREAEAKRCALEASKILEGGPELSVGIITFYSAQRDAIYHELSQLGYAECGEDGWSIRSEFRLNSSGEERLRVGSVDAFQGKEFDVVLLSVVRTWTPIESPSEDTLTRKLGFLRLPNRINVAMSRQKKLLIVVGDRALGDLNSLTSDDDPILPGLPAFMTLCGGAYGQVL